jgi:hypothetical protein
MKGKMSEHLTKREKEGIVIFVVSGIEELNM